MSPATSTISVPTLLRLLGRWQADGPAYLALAQATAALVAEARLPLGARLPAERDLAAALSLSRTTVSAAYDALRRHGYLVSRRGAGSWTALPRSARSGVQVLPHVHDALHAESSEIIDLTLAAPSAPPQVLPAVRAATEELPRYLDGHGYDSLGIARLRELIAAMYERRGLPTTPDQVLVTAGAQHALTLVLGALVGPGDRVVVESPTFPVALQAARGHAARVVPIDVTMQGWDAGTLESFSGVLRQAAPVLAYLVPDFHNPTGTLMPTVTREAVVAASRRAGAYVVADETNVDLLLDPDASGRSGQPPAPVAAFDSTARVITIGSASKTIWGGLRVGWIRADVTLVHRLAAVRARLDVASPPFEQLVAVALLEQHAEIVALRRAELRERRDAFVAALRAELPAWQVPVPVGGLSLWVELDAPISTALAGAAPAQGLRLGAGSRFGADATFERWIRLPFTLRPEQLVEAARRLAVLCAGSLADQQPLRAQLVV